MRTDTIYDLATQVVNNFDFDPEAFILRFRDTLIVLSSLGIFDSEVVDAYDNLMGQLEKDNSFKSNQEIVLITWQFDYMYQFLQIGQHFENRLSELPIDLSDFVRSVIKVPI